MKKYVILLKYTTVKFIKILMNVNNVKEAIIYNKDNV